MRKINFVNSEYYHIYNRGVDKRDVFLDEKDYWKFFNGMRDCNNSSFREERNRILFSSGSKPNFRELGSFLKEQKKMVNFVSYSLIPNHFHSIVQQLMDNGIPNVMHKLGTSYTNYFNKKNDRSGALFQGVFKAIHIDNEEYLQWLIGYVNGNIAIHGAGDFKNYDWSSYQRILSELRSGRSGAELRSEAPTSPKSPLSVLSGLDIVLSQFGSANEFCDFVKQVIKESRTKKEMEKYLLED